MDAGELDRFIKEEFLRDSDTLQASTAIVQEGFRDLNKYLVLKKCIGTGEEMESFATSKEVDSVLAWQKIAYIPQPRLDARKQFKVFIRNHGVVDKHRSEIWKAVTGVTEFKNQNALKPNWYENVEKRVFGLRRPKKFFEVPNFGGTLINATNDPSNPQDKQNANFTFDQFPLNEDGFSAASRILWCLALENADIDFAPMIPDVVVFLLLFLSESDAFLALTLMIHFSKFKVRKNRTNLGVRIAEENRPALEAGAGVGWYLMLTNRRQHIFLTSFSLLIEKHLPLIWQHIQNLRLEVSEFADIWFKRLFVGTLPFSSILRIFDVFLTEGSKVLCRVGLALLKQGQEQLMACIDKGQFLSTIQVVGLQFFNADLLMKMAYSFKTRKTALSQIEKHSKIIVDSEDVNEPEAKLYFRPKFTDAKTETVEEKQMITKREGKRHNWAKESDILEDQEFEAIWTMLPSKYKIKNPRGPLFTTKENGFSLKTLLENCENQGPVILIIKSKRGNVFGGFWSEGLRAMKYNENCYGNRDCFLFNLRPKIQKYAWRAGNSRVFCRITNENLQMGGLGLSLDNDLWKGSSEYCETYENEKMDGEREFSCVELEIYGFQ
eukprot:TRINITY_DN3779_c5_g1_i1.p1 TRINITY_DN3779_c5_g1~~TRINITY_DN3779_c5_g1_i1.p1  ORF type:complete len:607 (+),score=96.27 TRINITY_DN3779_c5_g1_i1:948-2768(+)